MLFTRQSSNTEPDPYTPLPVARARRASLAQEGPPTMASLTPQSAEQGHGRNTRVRSTSMPGPRPTITIATPSTTMAPSSTADSPVKPSNSPSRLPQYQKTPRRFHQQSVSLQIPKSSIPRLAPIRTSPSTPKIPISAPTHSVRNKMSVPLTRRFRKDDPLVVIHHLRNLLARRGLELGEYLHTDDLVALHDREIMERAHRLKQIQRRQGKQGREGCTTDDTLNVFGVTLRQTSLYASTNAIFGGYTHDLPVIVFSCVEELHQKGLSFIHHPKPSHRLRQLIQKFDSPSSDFGLNTSLADEDLNDIYDLLVTYLTRLPEAVFVPSEIAYGFESAVFEWCIMPEPDSQSHNPDQIKTLQLLLRLLPSPHLSLFVYLMAFVCQIAAREKANEIERIGAAFGKWMFNGGGSGSGGQDKAIVMMIWFIRNWGAIINGFFDDLPLPSSPHWKCNIMFPMVETPVTPEIKGNASNASAAFASLKTLPYFNGFGREGRTEVTPFGSAIKLGLVREQSYQFLTTNCAGSSRAASLIDYEISSSTASNSKQSDSHQPEEDDDMSRCSSGSALNERLSEHDLPSLELPLPPTAVLSTPRQIFPPESNIPKQELGLTSRPPSSCYSYSSREVYSPELKLDETYKRPLRVVNRVSSDDSLLSPRDADKSACGNGNGNGNSYGCLTSESEWDDGLAQAVSQFKRSNDFKHRRTCESELKDVTFDRVFHRCKADCRAYALVKDLQERLVLVTKERDDAIRRARLMV